jgi:polysaccharide deacetylase family protein (PEP-CTERM system associated)
MLALLSFDIEEWFHGVPDFSAASWADRQSTVEEEFDLIAAALADAGQAATFFVLEEVARAYPRVVREVAAAGWEVASHGAGHRTVYELSATEFRESLRRSLGTLEDLTGRKVIGYRAPMWSFNGATEWAVEILREQGIQYDSSVLLTRRGDPRAPFVLRAGGAEILEVPPAPRRLGPFSCPLSGGFAIRLMPQPVYCSLLHMFDCTARYAHFYFHPWEFSTRQRDLGELTWEKRFFFTTGRKLQRAKLRWLVKRFSFSAIAPRLSELRAAATQRRELASLRGHRVPKEGFVQRK